MEFVCFTARALQITVKPSLPVEILDNANCVSFVKKEIIVINQWVTAIF
jgi:hypothetical protein